MSTAEQTTPDRSLRSVAGRTAIVTGAASGMGRAEAALFAAEGARVVLADVSADSLEAVAAEIRAAHPDADLRTVAADVSDPDDLRRIVETAVSEFGGIDILVNNAGISRRTSLGQDSDEEFERTWAESLEVNLTAQVRLMRLALPHLRKSDAGRVVNIASTEALVAQGGLLGYSASKSGVVGITRSAAIECAADGITVNAVCPGPIETGMTAKYPDEAKAKYARRRVPMRRYGRPEEVAHMVLSLCLPAASYMTGAVVPVDGGMSMFHV